MWWCFHRCTAMYILMWLLVLCARSVHSEGNVGCLFISELCDNEEQCFDDNAFGRCQSAFDADTYQHELGADTSRLLQKELGRLFAGGYRWVHEYTQCAVQNILYAHRHGISYDPGLCARLIHLGLPEVPPDLFQDPESVDPEELAIIKFKPNRDNPGEAIYADEIFSPPVVSEVAEEDRNNDIGRASRDGGRSFDRAEGPRNDRERPPKIDSYSELMDRALEAAQETEELVRDCGGRCPDDQLPVVRNQLSSNLDGRAMFSDGGLDWVPASDDEGRSAADEAHRRRDDDDDGPIFLARTPDDGTAEGWGAAGSMQKKLAPSMEESEPEFRWKYKPRPDLMAVDVSKDYAKNSDDFKEQRKNYPLQLVGDDDDDDDNHVHDVVVDDYMENQLYAILPIDNGMSTFQRNMRHDIKKPGPNYAYHEKDDEDLGRQVQMMAEPGATLLTSLMERARIHQLHGIVGQPVDNQKFPAR